jgi:hypothetical protein
MCIDGKAADTVEVCSSIRQMNINAKPPFAGGSFWHTTACHVAIFAAVKQPFATYSPRHRAAVRRIAMKVRASAIPDCGGLLKRLSVQLAGMPASNFFEPSLSTHNCPSIFSKAFQKKHIVPSHARE